MVVVVVVGGGRGGGSGGGGCGRGCGGGGGGHHRKTKQHVKNISKTIETLWKNKKHFKNNLKTIENVKKNHGGTMGFIRYCPPWELGDWISATPTICELTVCRVKHLSLTISLTILGIRRPSSHLQFCECGKGAWATCNFGNPFPELSLPVLYPSLST